MFVLLGIIYIYRNVSVNPFGQEIFTRELCEKQKHGCSINLLVEKLSFRNQTTEGKDERVVL